VPLPISLIRIRNQVEGKRKEGCDWLQGGERGVGHLQNGKLARFNDEDGCEHEADARSKHGQSCE
jgi:hypothetical protein